MPRSRGLGRVSNHDLRVEAAPPSAQAVNGQLFVAHRCGSRRARHQVRARLGHWARLGLRAWREAEGRPLPGQKLRRGLPAAIRPFVLVDAVVLLLSRRGEDRDAEGVGDRLAQEHARLPARLTGRGRLADPQLGLRVRLETAVKAFEQRVRSRR